MVQKSNNRSPSRKSKSPSRKSKSPVKRVSTRPDRTELKPPLQEPQKSNRSVAVRARKLNALNQRLKEENKYNSWGYKAITNGVMKVILKELAQPYTLMYMYDSFDPLDIMQFIMD